MSSLRERYWEQQYDSGEYFLSDGVGGFGPPVLLRRSSGAPPERVHDLEMHSFLVAYEHKKQQERMYAMHTRPQPAEKPAQPPVTFQQLWDSYPWGKPSDNPAYDDQCAIRLSVALQKAGISMKSFSSDRVHPNHGQPSIGRDYLNGDKNVIIATRANELGEWLDNMQSSKDPKDHIPGVGRTERITPTKDWESSVKGRTGIIMFDGYWMQDHQTQQANATGGHIDLWNGSRLTISSVFDSAVTIGRFYFNKQSLAPPYGWSDLGNSKTILFWEVK